MKLSSLFCKSALGVAIGAGVLWATPLVNAADVIVDDARVTEVAVSGGADTANPGVTCIRITPAPAPQCTNGWIAIMNNNKPLLSTALLAKTTGAKFRIHLDNASSSQHCPWEAFTPCTVTVLMLN